MPIFKMYFCNAFHYITLRYHQCGVAWWNLFKPSHPSILNPHVWLATYRKWGNIFVPQVKTSKNILLPTEVLLQNIFVPPQVKPSNYFCPKSNIGHLQEMGEYFCASNQDFKNILLFAEGLKSSFQPFIIP